MDLLRNRALSASLFAIALGAAASRANAQQGTFTLPVEARCGNVLLQPGKYTISAQPSASWPQVIRISGRGKVVSILPAIEGTQPAPERSHLRIVTIGETRFIREFTSSSTGKTFTFVVPTATREEAVESKTEETDLSVTGD